jgi:hypothetical protein
MNPIPLLLCSHTFRDHFRLTHRPPQCERCYQIFEDVTQLTEHRRSEPPCSQNGIELKEGIDDGQWEMIEGVLRKSRNEPVRERKHEIDIWFEIWDILFPDTPRPISPCKLPALEYLLNAV